VDRSAGLRSKLFWLRGKSIPSEQEILDLIADEISKANFIWSDRFVQDDISDWLRQGGPADGRRIGIPEEV